MSLAPPQSHPQYGVTQLIYVLHALSLLIGIIGTATVIGAFLFGWPSIIAVIINYVKRGDVQGIELDELVLIEIQQEELVLLDDSFHQSERRPHVSTPVAFLFFAHGVLDGATPEQRS